MEEEVFGCWLCVPTGHGGAWGHGGDPGTFPHVSCLLPQPDALPLLQRRSVSEDIL